MSNGSRVDELSVRHGPGPRNVPETGGAAVRVPAAPVILSTASVYPQRTPDAFHIAAELGYDGIEVMVSGDPASQSAAVLRQLSEHHEMPIVAVHAPCLLLTQRVWGREPWGKLARARVLAQEVGASVVVVHPPFRWQRDYAREFVGGLASMRDGSSVAFAVENMFPVRVRGTEMVPYAPDWNPVEQDYPEVTLDISHTAVSGSDPLAMLDQLGDRLAHLHLADGSGLTSKDEHLVPGRGAQPCAEILERLAATGYDGAVVLEVNTRKAIGRAERMSDLAEALAFTRLHLATRVAERATNQAAGRGN